MNKGDYMGLTNEQWYKERTKGIGGSECSAILGLNPYMSNVELWEIKTGRKKNNTIDSNSRNILFGIRMEPILRKRFSRLYDDRYKVIYFANDLIRHREYNFIFSTLDGRLIDKKTNEVGTLEIKTVYLVGTTNKWNRDKIPDNYYCQCLQQLLTTGYDFVIVYAMLYYRYNNRYKYNLRSYHIKSKDKQMEIEYLKNKEIDFWNNHVLKDLRPNLILPRI